MCTLDPKLEIASIARFHDLRHTTVIIKILVDLNDVGMVKHSHVVDLIKDHAGVTAPLHDLLAHTLLTRDQVLYALYHTKAALANLPLKSITLFDRPPVLLHESASREWEFFR